MRIKWVRTGQISRPAKRDAYYSDAPIGIYRRRKDGLYYLIDYKQYGGWWCVVRPDIHSVGPAWPTRAAAKAACLIRLESMGFQL